jgi:hypothetical protein
MADDINDKSNDSLIRIESGKAARRVVLSSPNGVELTPTTPTDIQLSELIPLFRALLLAIANPAYVDKSANQMRAQVTGSVSAAVSSANVTNIGSFPGDHLQRMDNLIAWATNIRSLIT